MTKKERLEKLENYGYSPFHLFKNWYIVRPISRSYCGNNIFKKIAKHLRIVVKVESDLFTINENPVKPKGKLRI